MVKRLTLVLAAAISILAVTAGSGAAVSNGKSHGNENKLRDIKHIVVIYEENHSFDNLYGGWEGVRGLKDADPAHTIQLGQTGPSSFAAYECLYQDDANLQAQSAANPSAPLSATCNNTTGGTFPSHFANAPFSIDDYIAPTDVTCPPVLTAFSFPNGLRKGGINPADRPGRPRRPLRRLHPRHRAPLLRRAVPAQWRAAEPVRAAERRRRSDDGQLRHEVAAHLPVPARQAPPELRDPGQLLPVRVRRLVPEPPVPDRGRTAGLQRCQRLPGERDAFRARPQRQPDVGQPAGLEPAAGHGRGVHLARHRPGQRRADAGVWPADDAHVARLRRLQRQHAAAGLPAVGLFGAKLPPQTNPTIGDRMSAKNVDWAWYSGGWSNANGNVNQPGWTNGAGPAATPTGCSDPNVDPGVSHWPECPDNLFQYHHQPFNYYAAFSTQTTAGLANRAAHLRDEQEFIQQADSSKKAAT